MGEIGMANLETSGQTQMNKIEPREKIMEVPGESVVNTIVEKVSDGIIAKMNINEERRNREFTYQLKELEFYKTNFDKELKEIFDYWFELVRMAQMQNNPNLSEAENQKLKKKLNEWLNVEKISRMKMNTIKYGGTETGRVLALEHKLQQTRYDDKPFMTMPYIWMAILVVLKKEILGQKISTVDIFQIWVNDLDDHMGEIEDARKYILAVYQKTYGNTPYWID